MLLDSNPTTDFEIIHRVLDGDVNAFEALVIKYQHHIFMLVKNHIPLGQVEEVAQDVFVKAYRSLPTFRYKAAFQQWLSAIAVRTCYDFWRKEYRSREIPMSELTEGDKNWLDMVIANISNQEISEKNSQKEASTLLHWALEKLSAENRMVLELVYLEGHSVNEAANLLGWSAANIKIRLFRSRNKLRRLLMGLIEKQGRVP